MRRLEPLTWSLLTCLRFSRFSYNMAARVLQQCVRSLGRPSLRLCPVNLALRAAVAPAVTVHRPSSFAADSRRTRWLGQSRVSCCLRGAELRPSCVTYPMSFKAHRLMQSVAGLLGCVTFVLARGLIFQHDCVVTFMRECYYDTTAEFFRLVST